MTILNFELFKNQKELDNEYSKFLNHCNTVGELSNLFNINRHTLYGRLNRGWSIEAATKQKITKAEEE